MNSFLLPALRASWGRSWCASCWSATRSARLALLIRPRTGQTAQQRADAIVPERAIGRELKVYAGDVSLPNCGLASADYERLAAETTRVIHSAATVRFDHSLEEARQHERGRNAPRAGFRRVHAPRSGALPMWAPPMWRASAKD